MEVRGLQIWITQGCDPKVMGRVTGRLLTDSIQPTQTVVSFQLWEPRILTTNPRIPAIYRWWRSKTSKGVSCRTSKATRNEKALIDHRGTGSERAHKHRVLCCHSCSWPYSKKSFRRYTCQDTNYQRHTAAPCPYDMRGALRMIIRTLEYLFRRGRIIDASVMKLSVHQVGATAENLPIHLSTTQICNRTLLQPVEAFHFVAKLVADHSCPPSSTQCARHGKRQFFPVMHC
jgi:hypothetical protein